VRLCQLPDYYVHKHLNHGTLVTLLEAHQPPNTAVWSLYPQQRHLSPKLRKLVDYLQEGLARGDEFRQYPSGKTRCVAVA
ncbi:LysR substrate-binding domain-containing protein, partial [Pseudomonas syringae pv. tagetis]|uniref:LysR substrate-binding domain-containing protein n=1 Tax=Pseudomonas syringae group genomosp. 7 TaxID=251699 RepID=UPI0037704BC5